MSKPVTVVCIYTVKRGKEAEFEKVLEQHWPTLQRLGLSSPMKPQIYKGEAHRAPAPTFIEIFQWKDADAPKMAHQTPDLMKVWEPMGQLCEKMEFIDVEPLALHA